MPICNKPNLISPKKAAMNISTHNCLNAINLFNFSLTNWKLRVSTSGAHCTELTAGSLLTSSHIRVQMHSATARHEHGAQRNANGTAINWKLYNYSIH
jgi:hypothetical protein